jgi:Subtilase family
MIGSRCFVVGIVYGYFALAQANFVNQDESAGNSSPVKSRRPTVRRREHAAAGRTLASAATNETASSANSSNSDEGGIPNQYIVLFRTNVTDVSHKTNQLVQRIQRWNQLRSASSSWIHPPAGNDNDIVHEPSPPTPSVLFTFSRLHFKGSVISGMTHANAQELSQTDPDILLIEQVRFRDRINAYLRAQPKRWSSDPLLSLSQSALPTQDYRLRAHDTPTTNGSQDFWFPKRTAKVASASTYSWGMDRINQQDLPLDNDTHHNYSGAGVHVYILDSGIYPNHSEFQTRNAKNQSFSRAACSYNAFTRNNDNCFDGTGHGTHVAGTIGGRTLGVARSARLWSVKVLDAQGNGLASHVLAGIAHVVNQTLSIPSLNATEDPDNHSNANNKNRTAGRTVVVNMSFGGRTSEALNMAVSAAVASGIVFVTSAGNDGRPACRQSPASATDAITVAASNSRDRAALYSNFGSCVDIFG